MSIDEKANCSTHGEQQRTYVCQHIYEGLVSRERVGFFWAIEEPENPRPDAWCQACEIRVRKANGEWVDEALDKLQPKILCGLCYDLARTFHSGGNPWS
jgi:hypothetical protein